MGIEKLHSKETAMDQAMNTVATPRWMLDLFKAVDTLDISPKTGYPTFYAADVDAAFGPQVFKGVDAVKKFLWDLDEPFVTKHNVTSVSQVGNAFVMLGSADLTKKGAGPETMTHVAPLINVFWLNEQGKIARWVVTFPPGIEKSQNNFSWPSGQK
jgi:hypothetical protein